MELQDFAFFIWAPVLVIPLAAIYFVLRLLAWDSTGRLLHNAWLVWLAWFGSTIFAYLAVVVISSQLGIYWQLSGFWWIAVCLTSIFASNTLAVGITLFLTSRKSNREVHLLREERISQIGWPAFFETALITTMAAIASLVVSAVLASGVGAIYDHYYPKPKTDFAIYDI